MQLKMFYDTEYFQFIRDFVSQFKSTVSSSSVAGGSVGQNYSPAEEMKHSLYFSKSDSESVTSKKLLKLTVDYNAEVASIGKASVDHDKYVSAARVI